LYNTHYPAYQLNRRQARLRETNKPKNHRSQTWVPLGAGDLGSSQSIGSGHTGDVLASPIASPWLRSKVTTSNSSPVLPCPGFATPIFVDLRSLLQQGLQSFGGCTSSIFPPSTSGLERGRKPSVRENSKAQDARMMKRNTTSKDVLTLSESLSFPCQYEQAYCY
jgi:hypothetical protein